MNEIIYTRTKIIKARKSFGVKGELTVSIVALEFIPGTEYELEIIVRTK